MKTILAFIVLLALCLTSVAAPPPPVLYTRYTTNTTPVVDSFVVHTSNGFGTNLSLYGWVDWASGNVTYVPLTGDIQTYVNNATAGDTLILASGTYTLTNGITITKPLNIIGQGCAGFVTVPVQPLHGTLITSTSNFLTAFTIATNNIRIVNLSINLTGNTNTAISTGTNLNGLVFRAIDVIVTCASGPANGFVVKGSDAILRDLTFYCTSGNNSAIGLYMWQDNTCTNRNTVEAFNVTGTVKGGANWAYCFDCEGWGGTNSMTLNLDVCRGIALTGTPDDTAVASITSAGIDHSIVNAYLCTFDGADRDAYQSGTNQLNLGGSLTVNDRITGTVTYRAVMVAGKVTATNFTGNGAGLTNLPPATAVANGAYFVAGGLPSAGIYWKDGYLYSTNSTSTNSFVPTGLSISGTLGSAILNPNFLSVVDSGPNSVTLNGSSFTPDGSVRASGRGWFTNSLTASNITSLGISTLISNVGIGAAPSGPALLDIASTLKTNQFAVNVDTLYASRSFWIGTNGNVGITNRLYCPNIFVGFNSQLGNIFGDNYSVGYNNNASVIAFRNTGCGIVGYSDSVFGWSYGDGVNLTYLDTSFRRVGTNQISASGSVLFTNGIQIPVATTIPVPGPVKWVGGISNAGWRLWNDGTNVNFTRSPDGTNLSTDFGINTNSYVWSKSQMYSQQPVVCYGSMMMRLTNTLAVGPSAYTNIQNYDVAVSNQFFCNVTLGVMTNYLPGYYRVTICKSAIAGASSYTEGSFLTNGVDSELISFHKQFATGTSRIDNNSATGIIWLPANTQCSFAIKDSAAENMTIRRAQITIGTP